MNEREAIEASINALRAKLPHSKCPRCNTFEWNVETGAVLVAGHNQEGLSLPPPKIRTAFVTCKHCGWMAMHNLELLLKGM